MKRPVYVHGSGSCTAAGLGADRLWSACLDGRPLAQDRSFSLPRNQEEPFSLTVPFCSAPVDEACEAVCREYGKATRRVSRASLLAVYAASEALADAGQGGPQGATALVWGSGSSTIEPIEAGYRALMLEHKTRVSPMTVADSMASAPASAIASLLGIHGPSFSTASACASSAHAIALAAMLVADGVVDSALAGGSELLSDPGAVISWNSTGVLAKGASRPFDKDSGGINLGDGSGALFLSADPVGARARIGATAYSTGAIDVMSPQPESIRQCLSQIEPGGSDGHGDQEATCVISCHATGTPVGDRVEKECLAELSRALNATIICSATKAVTGHTMSASGVLEAIIAIHSLREQTVAAASCVKDGAWTSFDKPVKPGHFSKIYSSSFGFGGMNIVLSFEQI